MKGCKKLLQVNLYSSKTLFEEEEENKAILASIHYHLEKVNRPLKMACLKDWIPAPGAVTHPGRELRKADSRLEGWSYLKAKPERELAIKHVIVSFLRIFPNLLNFVFRCTFLFNVESDSSTADKPQASYWQRNSKSIMVCWLLLKQTPWTSSGI